jgi:SSS family solute:Na+ symporter
MFSFWDWAVVALYFAIMAGIGVYFSRRNRNLKDFMFGGGNMPWLAVGISLIATSVSASTFLGNPANSFANDMRLLMLNFGAVAAIFIIGAVFIPRYKASGVSSAYELLETKFSRPVRTLAAGLYSCHLLLRAGMLLFGPALILKAMLGVPIWASICVMAAGSVVYTYFGGIRAIAWTDVLQFTIFLGSGLLIIAWIAHAVGGLGETLSLAAEAGKTRWFSAEWDPASARNIWSAGVAYIAFEVAIRGCDQQFVQRYLSTRNAREANYSSIASVLLGICVGLVFFTVGAALYVYFEVKGLSALPAGATANDALPFFILNVLPTGLKGLLGAAIMGEALSSLNSLYSALSNTTVTDFLRRKGAQKIADEGRNPDGGDLRAARVWVLIWGGIATLVAFAVAQSDQTLLDTALFFTSLFTGPLLALFLMAFFRPGLNPRAVLAAAFGGMGVLLLFLKIPMLPAWEPLYPVAWTWNPLIAMSATVAIAHVLSPVLGSQKSTNRS